MVESLEILVVYFPARIMTARMIPRGTEGTLMAFSTTIMQLNQFTFRNLMGYVVN